MVRFLIISEAPPTTADDLADCLESIVLTSRSSAISIRKLGEFADTYLQVGDAAISFALSRMRRRQSILGSRYPIMFDVSSAKRTENSMVLPYSYFLFLAGTGIGKFDDANSPLRSRDQIFEELVLDALQSWLGEESIGLRFGWPSDLGRPPEFPDAIRWLASKMNIELGNSYRPPIRKDGGVDVIVWRPFGDQRSGFPIVLAQCTLQKDLISKSRDIDVLNWSGWLALDRPPITVLATPRHVDETSERWKQLTRQTMMLDRTRLSRMYPGFLDASRHHNLREDLLQTTELVREQLQV